MVNIFFNYLSRKNALFHYIIILSDILCGHTEISKPALTF